MYIPFHMLHAELTIPAGTLVPAAATHIFDLSFGFAAAQLTPSFSHDRVSM